jgi:hypothetical protein
MLWVHKTSFLSLHIESTGIHQMLLDHGLFNNVSTYSLAQQKRPRFPLLTKLISTADQIILKGKVTSFWQQFKAFLLYELTLLTNSSIPFLPWKS